MGPTEGSCLRIILPTSRPRVLRKRGSRAAERTARRTPVQVKLHLYDVTGHGAVQGLNKLFRAVGTGAFHAGIEVYGLEWSFGFSDGEGTGVFCCTPCGCPTHAYRESVALGVTMMSMDEVTELLQRLSDEWPATDYNLFHRNCCHFAGDFSRQLGAGPLPEWVNNLAGVGATLDSEIRRAATGFDEAVSSAASRVEEIDQGIQAAFVNAIGKIEEITQDASLREQWETLTERVTEVYRVTGQDIREKAGELDERWRALAEAGEHAIKSVGQTSGLMDRSSGARLESVVEADALAVEEAQEPADPPHPNTLQVVANALGVFQACVARRKEQSAAGFQRLHGSDREFSLRFLYGQESLDSDRLL